MLDHNFHPRTNTAHRAEMPSEQVAYLMDLRIGDRAITFASATNASSRSPQWVMLVDVWEKEDARKL